MTELPGFEQVFAAFYAMKYPDYPQFMELQDWNSRLLVLDAHVAGYASRISRDTLSARDVPDLGALTREVRSLRASLERIQPLSDYGRVLIDDYRRYVVALERLILEIVRLKAVS